MQKQTSLYIPKPCHEDWNKMTTTQQGKFCASCSKQVIDFSLMSDNQILHLLSNQSGKLCGRFDAEQLQRPLIETKIKKKKSWWMALTMPLLFLFDRSEAQGTVAIIKADTIVSPIKGEPQIMGKLAYQPIKQITITGKVVDEKNNPLAYASIIQKGTIHATTTDSLGNFSIAIKSYDDSVTLVASYVGYSSSETNIKLHDKNVPEIVMVLPEYVSTGLVAIVTSDAIKQLHGTVGGFTICRKVTPVEKVDTVIRKIFKISFFKFSPNPTNRGSMLHLEIKQAGEYQLQLLDNQSGLIKAEEINTVSEKSTSSITIPANISSGIYYLRLIDEQKKKSYTEKLIIQ